MAPEQPLGINQMMKRCLQNWSIEFENTRNNLAELKRRIKNQNLTEEQLREIKKDAQELLFVINKKIMSVSPADSRAEQLEIRNEK